MRKLIAAAALAVLAGCATPAHAHHAAAPKPAPKPTPPGGTWLTRAQMRQECAALDMVRMGFDTYANQVRVMAGQYTVDQTRAAALIRQAVTRYCPDEISVLP